MSMRRIRRSVGGALLLALLVWLVWRYGLDPQRELERRLEAFPDGSFSLDRLWQDQPSPDHWRLLGPYADVAAVCGAHCADQGERWVPECESWWLAMRGERRLTLQRVQCNRAEWAGAPPSHLTPTHVLQIQSNAAGRRTLRLLP